MSIETRKEGNTVILSMEGHLVLGNRYLLKEAIVEHLARGERSFVIDCGQTGYIDSSGLGMLVSVARIVSDARGEVRLAHLNDDLKMLLRLTRLDSLFSIDDVATPEPVHS